jgi:tetrapyrrole methylase family protein/MazG family protein
MTQSSLIVVGVGIKFISHLSVETKAYITQSERVLYLVNDPLMKDWIEQLNPSSESLDYVYTQYELRIDCYKAITSYILETLLKYKNVCVVMYGHPAVFAQPALDAVKQAKKAGCFAKILPAISAEDCLFADLLIDPGSCGCQSYEATDFLIHSRQFDTKSHLIVWQVGVIGALTHVKSQNHKTGIIVLVEYLKQFYLSRHTVTVYIDYLHANCKLLFTQYLGVFFYPA